MSGRARFLEAERAYGNERSIPLTHVAGLAWLL